MMGDGVALREEFIESNSLAAGRFHGRSLV
jgi:hypothetical protein